MRRLAGELAAAAVVLLASVAVLLADWSPWSVLAVAGTYVLADFLSGIYHVVFDHVVPEDFPVLGHEARSFRRHHDEPLYFLRDGALAVGLSAAAVAAPALLASIHWLPRGALGPVACLLFFFWLAPVAHGWAHGEAEAPWWAYLLQRAGILLPASSHWVHHSDEDHHGAYAILSGWTNCVLDRILPSPNALRALRDHFGAAVGLVLVLLGLLLMLYPHAAAAGEQPSPMGWTVETGMKCNRFVRGMVRCEALGAFPERPLWWVYKGDFRADPMTERRGDRIFVRVDNAWTTVRVRIRDLDFCVFAKWRPGKGPRFRNATPCPPLTEIGGSSGR